MFNWLFKRRDRTAAPTTTTPPASTKPAAAGKRATAQPAAPAPKPVVVDLTDWPAKLQGALGDDAALLQLAKSTPVLDIKIGAVEALAGEEALKQAEREFRSHDRKVHRIAKKRLEAAVAQRVARATAQTLIDRTTALIGDEQVAMNQVIELDRAWQALPADMLLADQRSRFTELRTRLDSDIRERSDAQQRAQRWGAEARLALPDLLRGIATATEQGAAADIAPIGQALQALSESRPNVPATAELAAVLAQAVQNAAAVEARLTWFETAPAPEPEPVTAKKALAPAQASAPAVVTESIEQATQPAPTHTPELAVAVADGYSTQPSAESAPAETEPSQAAEAAEPVAETGTPEPATAAPNDTLLAPHDDITSASAPASAATAMAMTDPAAASALIVEDEAVALPAPETAPITPAQRWNELPAVADAALARLLEQRFEQWQRARRPARQPARPIVAAVQPAKFDKPARPAKPEPLSAEQLGRIDTLVQQGETTLAEGQLSELQQQLGAIDAALGKASVASLTDDLRARLQLLRGEGARLKGWQQWGGGRARDDLTEEAEALAKFTLAASDPEQPDAPRVDVKAQRETIHTLRMRWKELDRLGAPANQTLWQRFDAALQTASVPVAAHHAALAAARKENQATREALLTALEALPLPGSPAATADQNVSETGPSAEHGVEQGGDQTTDAGNERGANRPIDWKDLVRELGNFQTAWRKLGPLEHTAPADAREALQQRHRGAIERIEAPLQQARRAAVAIREQLIAQAQSLVPEPGRQRLASEPGRQRPGPDAARQVRELQAQWQDHARQLPLARAVENEVWARFKAATDAVFAQREAVFAARDAEFAANLSAAEAVLERLGALNAETPKAEIERTIADADRAWREGGELPRGALDGVERRFRAARAAAVELLSAGVRARWQAQCDTLTASLLLCEEREAGLGSSSADELARHWQARGHLPVPWQRVLAERWARPVAPGPLSEAAVDELLLQLEAALNIPTTEAWQAERHKLKLRALKDVMEGRTTERPDGPTQQADRLAALFGQTQLAEVQHDRLHAIVAALWQAAPGALGSPIVAN
jgi:hypothetical protein